MGSLKELVKFVNGKEGATAVEYAIIGSLIAAVIVTVVATLGTKVSSLFDKVTLDRKYFHDFLNGRGEEKG